MQSTVFIRQAAPLITRIKAMANSPMTFDELDAEGVSIQRELNALFSGLHNPHLPSAHHLFLAARAGGFSVRNDVESRLAQFSFDNFTG
jgi:hypothetical protein